ncbi:hypothetical protein WICPIJ_001616 [Wickerhamomyces pijperi]|uniref:Mediator of RNA polymerase II transcription subunit 31 n=1 Tax=Wickerhamomyces pijperi TaxID=599730 RepID=A0A9P8QBA9_WICPI|nr:hypothetical protein WICPIJ_001616 [Wickerhamomyces pijperi]
MEESSLPTRWEIELEFIQSLANLQYVNYLAQNRHLEDPKFINYLRYLTYWKKPEYSRHLVYPNCLHILDLLLESKSFRQRIMRVDAMGLIMNEMVERWKLPHDMFTDSPPVVPVQRETKQEEADGGHVKEESAGLQGETTPTAGAIPVQSNNNNSNFS